MSEREELVEVMARASCFVACGEDPRLSEVRWKENACEYIRESIAALTALEATHVVVPRKPTVEMLTAGTEVFLQVGVTEGRASACWQAMIGVAHD